MLIMIILGYFVGVGLLIRFFQAVSNWDDEIEAMENRWLENRKPKKAHYRSPA
jgi:hypothetical protein